MSFLRVAPHVPNFPGPSPGRLSILFLVCNLYFLSFSLQPCYGTLPIPPSADKTNVVYPLQPLDEKQQICISGFFFGKIQKQLLHTEMENWLQLGYSQGKCSNDL